MRTDQKKIVVYTCIVAGYDILLPPIIKDTGIDFIVFTDDENLQVKGWETECFNAFDFENAAMANRYYKFFPHKVLKNYDYSLYIDGNLRVLQNLDSLLNEFVDSGASLGLLKHPCRVTLKEEVARCKLLGVLGDETLAQRQMEFYTSQGFKDDVGLTENNVIFRRHACPLLISAMELWWQQLEEFTKRDQLSLAFVRWKIQIPVIIYSWNAREDNPYFYLYKHRSKSKLENIKIRVKARRFDNIFYSLLYHFWYKIKECFGVKRYNRN